MGQKTVKVSYEEVRSWGKDSIGLLINQPEWFRKHGLDWQKPVYITPDEGKLWYYIDAWELEDVKKEED